MLNSLVKLYDRRDLVRHLIGVNLRLNHRNTLLGYLWWIIDPLLLMLIYVLLIGFILKRGEANYPLFIMSALLPWRWFATSMNRSVSSLVGEAKIIRQVAFPKAVLPVSEVFTNLTYFVMGLPLYVVFQVFYKVEVTANIAFLVIVVMVQLILTLGLSMLVSSLNVFFRDIKNIMPFLLRMWFYLSPVLYAVEKVPQQYVNIYLLNPFANLLPLYRDILLFGRAPDIDLLYRASVMAGITFVIGFWFFHRTENKIVKHIS